MYCISSLAYIYLHNLKICRFSSFTFINIKNLKQKFEKNPYRLIPLLKSCRLAIHLTKQQPFIIFSYLPVFFFLQIFPYNKLLFRHLYLPVHKKADFHILRPIFLKPLHFRHHQNRQIRHS